VGNGSIDMSANIVLFFSKCPGVRLFSTQTKGGGGDTTATTAKGLN